MKKVLLVLGVLLLLAVIAVPLLMRFLAPKLIQVPPPSGEPIGKFDYPRPETSLLAVKVRIPVAALQQAANKEAPRRLTGTEQKNIHKRIKNGAYTWNVARGSIRLQNTGKNLAFSVPIDGVANARGDLDAKILSIPLKGSAEIGGTVSGTVNPRISPTWEVIPNLQPNVNLTKANLNIGTLGSFSLRDLLQDTLNPIIQKEAAKIGPDMINELNIRKDMVKLWNEAHVSEQVNDEPRIWVNVRPNAVGGTLLDFSNPKEISTTLAIQAQCAVSNAPMPKGKPAPLANLQTMEKPPTTSLNIPVIVSMARLNQELAKEDFSVKTSIGAEVKIDGVKVRVGRDGFLNFSIQVNAKASRFNRPITGELWLQGKPVIDYTAQTLALSEVDFTVETRDMLTKGAAWMLEELLVKAIERELRVDLNDYKKELDEEVAKALASDDIPEGIEVSLKDLEVKLADIYTISKRNEKAQKNDPGVVVVIRATGEATTRITKIEQQ